MDYDEKNILRIDIPKSKKRNLTLGWQVKFNKKGKYPYKTKTLLRWSTWWKR